MSDPDGETVQGLFSVYLNGTGTPVIDKAYGSSVASGGKDWCGAARNWSADTL